MAVGPGKYDAACTKVREETGGSVLLCVISGIYGSGFSVQATPYVAAHIVEILRSTADQIEQSIPRA
ncbi:MAG TPA: hypothetical protein VGP83_17250 [Pyrinomonadaceae bacterium]|jgi:hypothetical protein|nr:hypothetical protein [Pyrinomonadaceae bacterium]